MVYGQTDITTTTSWLADKSSEALLFIAKHIFKGYDYMTWALQRLVGAEVFNGILKEQSIRSSVSVLRTPH